MSYPAQDISYTKLLGQLQDKGNTDLIKHYIELYEGAFLLQSIHKFSKKVVLSRASSPKLIPLCGALIDREVFETKSGYGRAVEAAVGACLSEALPERSFRLRFGSHTRGLFDGSEEIPRGAEIIDWLKDRPALSSLAVAITNYLTMTITSLDRVLLETRVVFNRDRPLTRGFFDHIG